MHILENLKCCKIEKTHTYLIYLNLKKKNIHTLINSGNINHKNEKLSSIISRK